MAGKQAKTLTDQQLRTLLTYAKSTRNPDRNNVVVLLSVKAGLRAAEIAGLTWPMVTTADGQIADTISLHDKIAKKKSGRTIPLHPSLYEALRRLKPKACSEGPVICSERHQPMTPMSIVNWFAIAYKAIGLQGCSSHSGRRTFITRAARAVHKAGGSLRDVQLLAGHKSIEITQRYISGDEPAQRRLVSLI
jgi:integrase